MRATLLLVPLALATNPAIAQVTPVATPVTGTIAIPAELTDPTFADRLTDAMHAMSKAFLDLPIGDMQAAIEGREATTADSRRTIRSETRLTERELRAQIEESRPVMKASLKAMAAGLPAMMKGMSDAAREMEKATANLPSPTYPKR